MLEVNGAELESDEELEVDDAEALVDETAGAMAVVATLIAAEVVVGIEVASSEVSVTDAVRI